MSEKKHTPGPWWIAGKGTIRWGDPNSIHTGWIGTVNWKNKEANAHMISAAPDMWAAGYAADTCLSMAHSYAREMGKHEDARHINKVQIALRASLAKAEGR